jgi:hypothetical protein
LLDAPLNWAEATSCGERLALARIACCAGADQTNSTGCGAQGHNATDVTAMFEIPLGVDSCSAGCKLAFANFSTSCSGLALYVSQQYYNSYSAAVASYASLGSQCGEDDHWLKRPGYGARMVPAVSVPKTARQCTDCRSLMVRSAAAMVAEEVQYPDLDAPGFEVAIPVDLFSYCYDDFQASAAACPNVVQLNSILGSLLAAAADRDDDQKGSAEREAAVAGLEAQMVGNPATTCLTEQREQPSASCAATFIEYYRVCQPVVASVVGDLFKTYAPGKRAQAALATWVERMAETREDCGKRGWSSGSRAYHGVTNTRPPM